MQLYLVKVLVRLWQITKELLVFIAGLQLLIWRFTCSLLAPQLFCVSTHMLHQWPRMWIQAHTHIFLASVLGNSRQKI